MRQQKNVYKDFFLRKQFIKYELKKIILKSIIQNANVNQLKKKLIQLKLNNITIKSNICKQINKCIFTGRSRGVYKFINVSRHNIKYLNNLGFIQNLKIASW